MWYKRDDLGEIVPSRRGERRKGDRRTMNYPVMVERRSGADRRSGLDRRAGGSAARSVD
jgi:hypothetical protein